MIKVELTEADALLFRKFREYQNVFEVLEKTKVFDIRNGSASLFFDSEGTLGEIKIDFVSYKRGKRVINNSALTL